MMKRVFTERGKNPYDSVQWTKRDVVVFLDGKQKIVRGLQFPKDFSDNQRTIAADKYLKLKMIPKRANVDSQKLGTKRYTAFFWKQDGTSQRQMSFKLAVHRLRAMWAYRGLKLGYFDEQSSQAFYDEIVFMMINQMFAPNSPQWFNTGLSLVYGIQSTQPGYYYCQDGKYKQYTWNKNGDALPKQQVSACYIHQLRDSLLGQQSITDMLTIQTRLFANGSGNGFNASALRALGQGISNGGKTSGMMSFLKIFDRNADAVKSGGRTRRRARNRVVDMDHPEIQSFIEWKVKQQQKIAAMITGSKINKKYVKKIYDKVASGGDRKQQIVQAIVRNVQPNMIQKAIDLAKQKRGFDITQMTSDFNGPATKTVSGQNANNNVTVNTAFMERVLNGEDYTLLFRKTGQVAKTISARQLLRKIAKRSWMVGDPGLYYIDNTNAWNTCRDTKPIKSANPCQQFLNVDNTSCNLGSVNLMKFKKGREDFNSDKFCHAVQMAYLAMDISVSVSIAPSPAVAEGTWGYRPLGLGFMNLGRLLMSMAVPYNSKKGIAMGRAISALMTGSMYKKSTQLRQKLGAFPLYERNKQSAIRVLNNHLKLLKNQRNLDGVANVNVQIDFALVPKHMYENSLKIWKKVLQDARKFGIRNNAGTCIRPTGTIGLMLDSDGTLSSQPQYKLIKLKKLADGGYLKMVSGYVQTALETLQYTENQIKQILQYIDRNEVVQGAPYIKSQHLSIFDCAVLAGKGTRYISVDGHLRMMSAINGFISMGISKTVNVPPEMTVDGIYDLFVRGWKMGLKALTLYRDGCRLDSPMKGKGYAFVKQLPKSVQKIAEEYYDRSRIRPNRKRMPQRRPGFTQQASIGGHKIFIRTGQYPDGSLGQIFIDIYKQGAFARTAVNIISKIRSKALQYGVPIDQVIKVFLNVNQQPKGIVNHPNVKMCQSMFDFVGRLLAYRYANRKDLVHNPDEFKQQMIQKKIDKSQLDKMQKQYVGMECQACGSVNMVKNGNCFVCVDCGTTSGCS